ncbi:hypothetical protein [Streptomyces virginiae]|uniref:hypothetical protein n=1 Tax=Streptomyces virginiae TaxID=1961 RepID=UPI00364CB04B
MRKLESESESERATDPASAESVGVRDPAAARHRAVHGVAAADDLLVASWPPGSVPADGGGTFPDDETPGWSAEVAG